MAAQQNNEERKEGQPRKRSRISIKKEGDKVYTATKDKAQKLEANTPALPAPTPLFKEIPALPEQTETVAPVAEKTAQPEVAAAPATEEKPKAKRGRKPGSKINLLWQKKHRKPLKINLLRLLPNRLHFLSTMTTWNFHRST